MDLSFCSGPRVDCIKSLMLPYLPASTSIHWSLAKPYVPHKVQAPADRVSNNVRRKPTVEARQQPFILSNASCYAYRSSYLCLRILVDCAVAASVSSCFDARVEAKACYAPCRRVFTTSNGWTASVDTTPAVKPAEISIREGGSLWSCPGCGYVRGMDFESLDRAANTYTCKLRDGA